MTNAKIKCQNIFYGKTRKTFPFFLSNEVILEQKYVFVIFNDIIKDKKKSGVLENIKSEKKEEIVKSKKKNSFN